AVALDVGAGDVLEQPATTADQQEEAATRVVIVLVGLEVLGEPPDALGEKGDLRLGRARVGLVDPELGQDGLLLLGGQRHVSLLVVPVRVDTWPRRRGPQEGRSTTIPAGSSDERIAAGSAPEYRPCPPHVAPHRVEELVDGGELLHV